MPDDPGPEPTPPTAAAETSDDDDDAAARTAGQVAESAAEIALGAVIAPFTGGETVTMVESIRETVEEGVDRLTHLGHHEAHELDDDGPDTSVDAPTDDGRE